MIRISVSKPYKSDALVLVDVRFNHRRKVFLFREIELNVKVMAVRDLRDPGKISHLTDEPTINFLAMRPGVAKGVFGLTDESYDEAVEECRLIQQAHAILTNRRNRLKPIIRRDRCS